MRPEIDDLISFELFKDLRSDELVEVARNLEQIDLSPGEVLFQEGDEGEEMYFLFKGRVQIDRGSSRGRREVLATIDSPSVIGEMALLDHKPRSARVVAVKPSIVWKMGEKDLLRLAEAKGLASYKIMRLLAMMLSERLRATNDRLIEIYAKPFQSIVELKERLKEINPEIIAYEFKLKNNETP
jgi:CRP/FNR family transcriptional regulator